MGDLFLLSWERLSQGETDIAARGPFLLVFFVPYFAVALATMVALAAALRARRLQRSALGAAGVAISLILLAVVVLYVDPGSVALRALSVIRTPLARAAGYPGIVVADLGAVAAGLALARRAGALRGDTLHARVRATSDAVRPNVPRASARGVIVPCADSVAVRQSLRHVADWSARAPRDSLALARERAAEQAWWDELQRTGRIQSGPP